MMESLHIRILIFSHPYLPDAKIQVPAGTVKESETAREAILREDIEETGLKELEKTYADERVRSRGPICRKR